MKSWGELFASLLLPDDIVESIESKMRGEDNFLDWKSIKIELTQFLHYAYPPTISYALDTGVEIISLYFVSKLGEKELAAAGLAFMISNMSGHAVYTGISTALGTMASQAFGAEKYRSVGIIVQQCTVVMSVSLIPISLAWLSSGTWLKWSGVAESTATLAGRFLCLQILSLPPMVMMQIGKVWLEAQGILKPITGISFVICFFAWFFNWLLVDYNLLGLGMFGAPIAVMLAYVFGDIAFFGYIWSYDLHKQTWSGWSSKALIGIKPFVHMSLMGAGMVCLEWWSYEILGVLGNQFGETSGAVQTVLVNFSYFMYAVPEGIAIAAGVRVGNALGAGKPHEAKRAAYVAIFLGLGSAIIMVLPLYPSQGQWSSIFLQEEGSVELVAKCTPALILFLILNSGYGAFSGILLGSGKQNVGFVSNLVACYLVGIPLGLYWSFWRGFGVLGLWWGQGSGLLLLFLYLMNYVLQLDWGALAVEAHESAQRDDEDMGALAGLASEQDLEGGGGESIGLSALVGMGGLGPKEPRLEDKNL